MRTEAHKIIQEIEDRAFIEGFKAGWYAATKQMNDALKQPVIPFYTENKHNSEKLDFMAMDSKNPFRPGTESSSVYNYIRDNPGKRGNFIIQQLGISPKSARNAFHRLKKRGLAVNKDGWRVI